MGWIGDASVVLGPVLALLVGCRPAPAAGGALAGDCDGDGRVQVAEIVTLVAVGLGERPINDCSSGDLDHDGAIAVAEILAAVANAVDAARADCEDYMPPANDSLDACPLPETPRPDAILPCSAGSGHLGRWTLDAARLPAYDFAVDQRCDPRASAYTPRATPLRDPIHLIGNGHGVVAMAHASGAVELYTQDRGHKWINRVDTWEDPQNPDYPPQLGGGFSYYTVARNGDVSGVRSTRFEDLPVAQALERQDRRFGVGYYETVTRDVDLVITRRVFAPDADARALLAEVTIENRGAAAQVALTELWDVNIHQIPVELVTSDLLQSGITEAIDRNRRALMRQFTQHATWDATQHMATLHTVAKALPAGVRDRLDVATVDWFPDPIYLAVLDDGVVPDAVWLRDDELWTTDARRPPTNAGRPGSAVSRSLDIDGEGQHALLALRVPIEVPSGATVTRRFAFGYAPAGETPDAAVAALRRDAPRLRAATEASWQQRLVWASFPGLADAAVVQREIAWAAYNAIANTTYDEYRGVRLLGQGGSYKYIHGLDGAMGDLALFAEAMLLIDPAIAADTLAYALATQHGPAQETPWRFPYATTGVGAFSDVLIYGQRSDAYYFLPAAIGRYVALTRDTGFLDRQVPFWPRAAGVSGDVVEHIARALDYGTGTLGFGARGLVAIGTGDYADGINSLATEPATPTGSSSTYNAGAIVYGFPLAADVVEARDPGLAARMRELVESQTDGLLSQAWQGQYFLRGFVDSGNPLAPQIFFLEPQVFPVLAGIADAAQRDSALDLVVDLLETDIGAISNVTIGPQGPEGGIDRPLVGGIWPVANAWLTGAYARRDPQQGWSSFVRNTLAAHAAKYPDLWYGIWTGPDSFNGPDKERPGEADAHLVTALTDYPALNVHVHTSPLRALMDLVGVEGTRDGIRIAPRVPTETFSVRWPRLSVHSTPDSIEGTIIPAGDGPLEINVALPSGLQRGASVIVQANGEHTTLEALATVRFTLQGRAGEEAGWSIHPGRIE